MVKPRSRSLSPCRDFFKVYLEDFSSDQMSLPPAFVAELNEKGNVPSKVTLTDPSGKVWNVGLEKNQQDLVISEGWKHFVAGQSLADGDFLVFNYDQSCNFDIEMFGINGLKKRKGVDDDIPIRNVKVENDEESVDTQQDTQPNIQSSGFTCRGRQPNSVETTPKDLGEVKVEKARSCAGRESIQFESNITTANYVNIPKTVLKTHNIKLKEKLILHDEEGKDWPVRVNFGKRIIISSGFMDFMRGRVLQKGDKIVFSFLLNEGKKCNVLNVKVIRKRGSQPSNKSLNVLNVKGIRKRGRPPSNKSLNAA